MGRIREKTTKKDISPNLEDREFLKKIIKEDQITLERIKELTNLLKLKYNLSSRDIIHLTEDKDTLIPVSIFTKKLT